MANITIIGPGAIGLCVGAALLDGGHKVNFIGRKTIDEFTVIKDDKIFRQYQLNDDDHSAPVEWLLICVKAHQVESAKETILSRINSNTKIAIIQNGVEHIDNMNAIGLFHNLLEVMIDLPAKRLCSTEVVWRDPAISFVQDNPLGQEFSALFNASFIKVETTPDIKTKLWRKLCINAPGAILCLTGRPMSVFHEQGIANIGRGIIREVINVGRKEGAILEDEIIEELTNSFLNANPESTNSMFEDYKAGHPTEWDARNAVLVKLGKKHGVPTPISDLLVPLLAAQKRVLKD